MPSAILYFPAAATAWLSSPLSECTSTLLPLMPLPEFYHHTESRPQVLPLGRSYTKPSPCASLHLLKIGILHIPYGFKFKSIPETDFIIRSGLKKYADKSKYLHLMKPHGLTRYQEKSPKACQAYSF